MGEGPNFKNQPKLMNKSKWIRDEIERNLRLNVQ